MIPLALLAHEQSDAVSHNLCLGCGLCALSCPVGAIVMEEVRSQEVTRRSPSLASHLCVHCGRCAAACPSGTLQQFRMEQLLHQVQAEAAHTVIFFCENLNSNAQSTGLEQVLEGASLHELRSVPRVQQVALPANTLLETVRCTGRLGPRLLTRLCAQGVRRVVVFACPPHACLYSHGRSGVAEQVASLQDTFVQYGLPQNVFTVVQKVFRTQEDFAACLKTTLECTAQ